LGEEREGERMTGGARGRDFWKKEKGGGRLGRPWAERGEGGDAAGPAGRPTREGRGEARLGRRARGCGWAEMGKGERERKRKGFSFSKI
jgi:hypothetical protein